MSVVPTVELFTTSILSNHKVRHRHERYLAVFAAKRIDYVYHDLASDEDAKKRFRRKAADPQIPNILVHNEWRGTFEEFEEAVEFGELDLFLRIDPAKVAGPSPVPAPAEAPTEAASATPATTSKLPPAPTAMPKMAPAGSGAGPRRNSMDDFLDSLEAWKPQMDSMSDADVSALLEEGESSKARQAHAAAPKAPQDTRDYPGHRKPSAEGAAAQQVKRTYFPSEKAGTRPLRLPKMGDGARAASSPVLNNSSSPSSSNDTPISPRSPAGHSRFSVSQNSSRALAAEASASASHRTFSARQLRSGLDSGRMLQDVMGELRDSASSRRMSRHGGVGGEADALLEELGLADLKLTEEEAEAFLLDGAVPEGLELGGSRLKRGGTKAREHEAARDVAERARTLADERRASATVAKERKERERADSVEGASVDKVPAPADMSKKTKELLERAKEKRASRQIAASAVAPSVTGDADGVAGPEASAKRESLLPAAILEKAAQKEDAGEVPPEDVHTKESGEADEEPSSVTTEADPAEKNGGKQTKGDAAPSREESEEVETSKTSEDATPDIPTPAAEPTIESAASSELQQETPPPGQTAAASSSNVDQANDSPSPEETPKVRQPALPASTVAPPPPAAPDFATNARAATAGEDEEIDDLFARLSGLGENQRLSAVLGPSSSSAQDKPTSEEKSGLNGAGLEKVDEEESKADEPADKGEERGASSTAPREAVTPASPSAGQNPSAAPDSVTSPTSSAQPLSAASMNRSVSSTSNASGTSSSASSSARKARPSEPNSAGSRKGMDLTRRPSYNNLASPPLRPSNVSGGAPNSAPPEGYHSPASPTSPKSPTLKARLKSFGSLGNLSGASRKSSSTSGSRSGTPASPPGSAGSKMSFNGDAVSPSSSLRSQKTLSQILRDADAAMAGEDDDDEDGSGVGPTEEDEADDGLGRAEIRI
ncbi:hypothetical protein BDZ90DRAFT_231773 [Jaminaea rosea]|uniref:SH3 domain-containing protein n=1 Tax=Jaminaea rosea TaxID=1569628 RepID=A0A316URT9_9BASI|nr:hypothetical protein BDZ90DRAFT_231773 [Jaminaea rosea]PWN28006.1 hypothetical protein BDZ90DRAFT_231773 [Jaminaea rosea]